MKRFGQICINNAKWIIYKHIFPSIANLKCTPSDRQMYRQGYMYPSLGTPELEHPPIPTYAGPMEDFFYRDTGERRYDGDFDPCSFKRGATRAQVPFQNKIVPRFIWRSIWSKFIAAICTGRKFRMFFYNFCFYFWGQHCYWTETSIIYSYFYFV